MPYHVLNRAARRERIFRGTKDFEAFFRVLQEAHDRVPIRILAYSIMPNHWHLVLWPRSGPDMSEFMRWLTETHTQRLHAARGTTGSGAVYQGRYRSFPIQGDSHLLTVLRYVERNALRAALVDRAEDWKWSSLWLKGESHEDARDLLCDGPLARPPGWVEWVNAPLTEAELIDVRRCVVRGRPFGSTAWVLRSAKRLGLESTLRPRGRPPGKNQEL